MRVLKFGGSALADGAGIRAVGGIVEDAARTGRACVVLSAMRDVTDALIAAARQAEAGRELYRIALEAVRGKHIDAVRVLFPPTDHAPVITQVQILCNELEEILHGVELIRECSPRTLDLVMSFGERLSCALVSALLSHKGLPARTVDARELIRTDAAFTHAAVDFPATYALIQARLDGFKGIPVIPGFLGATEAGVTTTLGRNGSDYTASIVASGLGAENIDIWTDVDGVSSADPQCVEKAFIIPEMGYEEAMELSYFGARILHPFAMVPAVEKGIPIRIRNVRSPAGGGTRISREAHRGRRTVTGIASIEGISLVNIEGGGMMGIPGFAARAFGALARAGVNIIMISQASSEHTICLVFRSEEGERAVAALRSELAAELEARRIQDFSLRGGLVVVSVIGENMRGAPGMAGRLFSALGAGGVNILVIAQGSSERNISFVVDEKDRGGALRTVHKEFLEDA